MTTAEILRAARAVIDTPEKWTKGYYAYDAHGSTVDTDSPDACRFCAVGALWRVGDTLRVSEGAAVQALSETVPADVAAACEAAGSNLITAFNDDPATTHADVLAAFDRAIAVEETSA